MHVESEQPSKHERSQSPTPDPGDASTRVEMRPERPELPEPDAGRAPSWPARSLVEVLQPSDQGQRLGRYIVLGTLGRGGMGTVLEAFDRTLDRRVALKVLHRSLDEHATKRLLREAQALAKLSHPHVVQIYEVGEAEGQTFIAMELVQGRSLWEWLSQGPRPGWRECVQAFLQAGEGLAAAHARGLVHRDFKPANAVIDDEGRVRVLDFGLARRAGDATDETTLRDQRSDETMLSQPITETGTVMGTPAYMAPEQMEGLEADARSDQFAFCVALYEALYWERPYEGRSMQALAASLRTGRVRAVPRDTEVPAALRKLVLRGLSVEPDDRWPSMQTLLVELRRVVSPPTRGWLTLSILGGLTAVGLGLAEHAEVGRRCQGAAEQLQGIWDDERRHALREAILGTDLSYASDTWARVEPRLDEYASAWADKHTEVCEATSVRQEQSAQVMDLRMECLRGRRVALREAVEVLAQADDARVRKAVELVSSLPSLSWCDEVEALANELPLPEDPLVVARAESLRGQLVHARMLQEVGAYDSAVAVADAVAGQAEELSYAPLLAEALLLRGDATENAGRYVEAEADLKRAYLLAAELGHDRVEAMAVAQLTGIVGLRLVKPDAAMQWGETALALSRGSGVEANVESIVLNNIGGTLFRQGKLEDALTHLQHALTIKEEVFGPLHHAVAGSLNNVGAVLFDQGRQEEALAQHRRALAIYEQAFGPRHPNVAGSLTNNGLVLFSLGRREEALAHHQRALAIYEEALGPRHPEVANSLTNNGLVLWGQGKLEEALAIQRRALTIREEAFGPGHPQVAKSLEMIALVLQSQGKLDEALAHQQRTLAIREKELGGEHPHVAMSLANIGTLLLEQGKLEEALSHHQRALAIREQSLGPDHPEVAASVDNVGLVRRAQGRLEEALGHHQRALAMFERALGPRHPDVVHPLMGLAELALARNDAEGARVHAERALSIFEEVETWPDRLAKVRFVLARALWPDPSQRTRARALAEQARNGFAALGEAEKAALAEVEAWLAEHPARA